MSFVGATGRSPAFLHKKQGSLKYNPEVHHRRSVRLKEYDYSQNGTYFLTLCSHNRECLFGEIVNNKMVLNDFGMILQNEWIKSQKIRSEIELDSYIVMPNHLHGIVMIHANYNQKQGDRPMVSTMGPKNKSIGALVAGFKSAVTKQINEMRGIPGCPVWQRNYHEHIIRNDQSLEKIREYVVHNPETWEKDALFLR